MLKKFLLFLSIFLWNTESIAGVSEYDKYFKVDMKMEIPNVKEFIKKYVGNNSLYDKGYKSRLKMGNTFKKEFSKTIKFYGLSEGRIKNNYEDDLLEIISWLPKETYQYIGPMLHEVPGMSEKVLNLPGIKETKNKFPERVADRMKAIEGIEHMSPALYFLLMPEVWGETEPQDMDTPVEIPVKKPRVKVELPDFLKEKIGVPVDTPPPPKASTKKKALSGMNFRTISPSLTTPLTTKDAKAFVDTIDEIMEWGTKDNMRIFASLITGEYLLDAWEIEQGTALTQNMLKDIVNPCQRFVLKTRFAGLYGEFRALLAKHGYTPEEWAYVGDKTIKAFRVASSSPSIAHAVRYHRKGYYNHYIDRLPKKWRDEMYASEAAIIKMYAVFKEDVEAVLPIQDEINKKFVKIKGAMLTAPVIY